MDLVVFRSGQTDRLVVLPSDLVAAVEAELMAVGAATTYGELRELLPDLRYVYPAGADDEVVLDPATGEWVEVDDSTAYDALSSWTASDDGYPLPELWMLDVLPTELVDALVDAGAATVDPGNMSPEILRIEVSALPAVLETIRAHGHDVRVDDGTISW